MKYLSSCLVGIWINRIYKPFYVLLSFQASSAPLHADGLLGDVVNLLLSAGQALVSLFCSSYIFALHLSNVWVAI